IFEVRGLHRVERGHFSPPRTAPSEVEFTYQGTDGAVRRTLASFWPEPDRVDVVGDRVDVSFTLRLAGHQTKVLSITFDLIVGDETPETMDFDAAVHRLRRSYEDWERESTHIVTDNEVFNQLVVRGLRDIRALYTMTDRGGIIAAGIPWFVAVFGRDALITSHQILSVNSDP